MKCIIPGSNVKVFGRAVHCLSKVGDDLYMEPLDTGLALRAVNSSRSAYSCFLFSPNFFLRFDDGSASASQSSQTGGETTRWRITMKSCLAVFKSLYSLEKNVDRCNISLDTQECRLVFQLHCRHGIVKTYNLVYQETETLQAVFSKDLCPNRIKAPSKLLAEAVSSFQASQEEITLIVSPVQLSFKNYVDDEPDPSKVVHSELQLVPEEFEEYSIGVDTSITFCLKELRAILSFSDSAGLPITLYFETTGKPIVFCLESDQTVEATFVLATLADVSSSQVTTTASQQTRLSQSTQATVQHRKQNRSKANQSSRYDASRQGRTATRADGDTRRIPNGNTNRSTVEEEEFPDDLMMDLMNRHEKMSKEHGSGDTAGSSRLDPPQQAFTAGDDADVSASPVIPFDPILSHKFQKTSTSIGHRGDRDWHAQQGQAKRQENGKEGGPSSPNRTLLANFIDVDGREDENDDVEELMSEEKGGVGVDRGDSIREDQKSDDNDDGFDFVPGTPPSKKFKSMFFGPSQSQQSQSSTLRSRPQAQPESGSLHVLAEDSDED
ncbi:cell cycle checkpoint control protein RAD9B-like [Diadema antillarum]|uniref:cell cycle checkpoint control protein RAD9B-like n=1 Tax=Diadema antillarum TaxID=105358 RepID=UPI003A84EA71